MFIDITEPKYSTKEVLLACYKVKDGENVVRIRKGAHSGKYTIDGERARGFRRGTNGVIDCYFVPLSELQEAD